jgi:hypothetical protein
MITRPEHKVNTVELSGTYTQTITLPKNSILIDLVRRNVQGYCSYTLVYQHDFAEFQTSEYDIIFNATGTEFTLDAPANYLTTIQEGYDESCFSIVHWRRVLTDAEKRELKIDHLLT